MALAQVNTVNTPFLHGMSFLALFVSLHLPSPSDREGTAYMGLVFYCFASNDGLLYFLRAGTATRSHSLRDEDVIVLGQASGRNHHGFYGFLVMKEMYFEFGLLLRELSK